MTAYLSKNIAIYGVIIDNRRNTSCLPWSMQMNDEIWLYEEKRRAHNFITSRNIEKAEHWIGFSGGHTFISSTTRLYPLISKGELDSASCSQPIHTDRAIWHAYSRLSPETARTPQFTCPLKNPVGLPEVADSFTSQRNNIWGSFSTWSDHITSQ